MVKQKSFIDLNEKGTEAAAATIAGMIGSGGGEPPTPMEFKVNRPFVYVMQEKTTGTILFIGKIEKL